MSIKALNWAFNQNLSNSGQKLVLIALADNADDYGVCWPAHETIAKKCSTSSRTVIRNIKALIEIGLVEKKLRTNNSNIFILKIGEKITKEHPLKEVVTKCHPKEKEEVTKCHPPLTNCHPTSDKMSPKPSLNHQITKKEKKALTRDEFMRIIDKGYQSEGFNTFNWLTESEIKSEADACLDFYGAKDEWPAGDPVTVLRHWLRGGIQRGSVRAKPKGRNACQGGSTEGEAISIEPWQEKAREELGEGIYTSWIKPLSYDGESTIIAPTGFMANYVQSNFYRTVADAVGRDVTITVHQ